MSKPRVAVIGAGYFGRFHHEAWSRMREVHCAASVDTDIKAAKSAAADFDFTITYPDVTTILADFKPEIVDITSPPETHFELIKQIAETGAAIQCQKPFCSSLAEAREAVKYIEANKLTVSIHENFRYQPWHRQIKAILDKGLLGEIYQATFYFRPGDGQGPNAYLDRQPYFQKMERFLIHETAVHQIDLFRFFFGEPATVFASLIRLNPAIAGEDAGMIILDYESGLRTVFDGNRLVDHKAENTRRTMGEFRIEGSKGTLHLDGDAKISLRWHGAQEEVEHPYEWNDNLFGGDCVYETCRAFLGHVQGGKPLENSAAEYLRNLEIEDAVYRSNEEGRWIPLK